MTDDINVTFEQFLGEIKAADIYRNQIAFFDIDSAFISNHTHEEQTVHLEALYILLVSKGEIVVTIDYIPYRLDQFSILELTHGNLLNSFTVSNEAKACFVAFSKELLRELLPVFQRVPKDYMIHKNFAPTMKLDSSDFEFLSGILCRLRKNIHRETHSFSHDIVLNETKNFLMEVLDIGMRNYTDLKSPKKVAYSDDIAIRFINLLIVNGKHWDEVTHYADELRVTPVYLSRAIKSLTGKTVMEWINEVRLSEAKVLLRKPGVSVQAIAAELHFSDQSSFGKFFKKHTGLSPLDYRKKAI